MPTLSVQVAAELWFLLPRPRRTGEVTAPAAPTDTLGHVVQSLGVPLTEVGQLRLDGRAVPPQTLVGDVTPGRRDSGPEAVLQVPDRPRPQPTSVWPPRFLLDVHLGSLARRLRLLGVDTGYRTEAADADLVRWAATESRVLLTRDRGLLARTALPEGALVRHDSPEDQLVDVLDRFAPPLAPWTRCGRCNGLLAPASHADVAARLEPGTRRSYQQFARCRGCGAVYWRGAHRRRLEAVVRRAEQVVAARQGGRGR
ncbi:Mut7-C RNAse domain-containing protein [Ornithinicoccus halotolerans]|uniref:Mut7-C RNAse domain-containing protein n=1 Tax=Ornithinicoccus halotolerans TaxID=1748220 RepID=UPI00129738CB|nr:Mut7-C RNAse domain-containing protein [Ornithinicoccus halotolerans]